MTTGTPAPAPAPTARLGSRTLHRVGYGAAQLDRLLHRREEALALVRRAVELGVDHVDTADFYGHGYANDVLREALRPEDDVLVVTKVGAVPDPGGPLPLRLAQRPAELRAAVEDNLRGLGVERLDVVNLRRLDVGPGLRAEGEQVVDLDDQLAELLALREKGLIGEIGLSGVDLEGLRRALPAGIVCVQNAYSLLSREDEEMLRLCEAENIAWVPFFPLGGAFFPDVPKVTEEPLVRRVAESLDVTPSQVGLAWLLHHAPNVLLIPGTADAAHLEANLATAHVTLDAETLAALDALASTPADARK
ncbi:aldo/keto reductase [Streptomyces griseoaurantiacus]|uniref:aldo/keto reductase n=1 Tax=Streptomyces griseoaurantiacus TaxID=68213 RepID=UPI003793BE64